MILIADGGSTTANWCLAQNDNPLRYFETEGYNPYFVSTADIIRSLPEKLPANLPVQQIHEVHFYGAGCSEDKKTIVKEALEHIFPSSTAYVEVDLLGAARALLRRSPGFAAILGTGMNSCLYDGKRMTQHIDSYGFLLGDEGSAGYIGRKHLVNFMRGFLPEAINRSFNETFRTNEEEIMHQVYKEALPNRYCAGFARFVHAHIGDPYMFNMVKDAFHDFFKNIVCGYDQYRNHTFNCVGSLGYAFRDILTEVAGEYGMKPGKFIQTPIQNLVEYHLIHHANQ